MTGPFLIIDIILLTWELIMPSLDCTLFWEDTDQIHECVLQEKKKRWI